MVLSPRLQGFRVFGALTVRPKIRELPELRDFAIVAVHKLRLSRLLTIDSGHLAKQRLPSSFEPQSLDPGTALNNPSCIMPPKQNYRYVRSSLKDVGKGYHRRLRIHYCFSLGCRWPFVTLSSTSLFPPAAHPASGKGARLAA